jgi:hypothetical protein
MKTVRINVRHMGLALLLVACLIFQPAGSTPASAGPLAQEEIDPSQLGATTRVVGEPPPLNTTPKPEDAAQQDAGTSKDIPDQDVPPEPEKDLNAQDELPVRAQYGWEVLEYENFEGSWPNGLWSTFDNNGATGGYVCWDDDDYKPYANSWSAWAARGCTNGWDPYSYYYPNNMDSWMTYGPFSLSGYSNADFEFEYWLDSEPTWDYFEWCISSDGVNYNCDSVSGNSGGWVYKDIDLSAYLGDPSVYIAFIFYSDGSNSSYNGAFVDDIAIWRYSTSTTVTAFSPLGVTNSTSPTFTWQDISAGNGISASQYYLQVENLKTGAEVFAGFYDNSYCDGYQCWTTLSLGYGIYRWYVQAETGPGIWTSASYTNFAISSPPFSSNFNTSHSGWSAVKGAWLHSSGKYYKTSGYAYKWASIRHPGTYTVYDYSVSMKRTGCPGCANTIIVSGTPTPLRPDYRWKSAYLFSYENNRKFSVWKVNGSSAVALKNWTSTTAIKANAFNTLRVVDTGKKLYFYINNKLVWSKTENSLSGVQIGIGMYRDGSAGNLLYVDSATLTTGGVSVMDLDLTDQSLAEMGESVDWDNPGMSPTP